MHGVFHPLLCNLSCIFFFYKDKHDKLIKWTGKKKMGRADESHDMSHILHIGKNPLDSWTEELGLVLIRGL